MAEPAADHAHAAAAAAVAARGAGNRHAEARLFRRARLVRHSHVRPPFAAHVVAVVRRLGARHVAGRRPVVPRHRSRLPAFLPLARLRRVAAPDPALARSGAPRAALEPPRRPQLGGRHDAAVGALLDDLAALHRFTPQLPRRRRIAARRAAAGRVRGQPQPGRCAAGAVPLFREPGDRPRRESRRSTVASRCSSSTAATTAIRRTPDGWRMAWTGQRRGDDTERYVLYLRSAP